MDHGSVTGLTGEVMDEKFEFLKEHFLYEIQQLLTGTYILWKNLIQVIYLRLTIIC